MSTFYDNYKLVDEDGDSHTYTYEHNTCMCSCVSGCYEDYLHYTDSFGDKTSIKLEGDQKFAIQYLLDTVEGKEGLTMNKVE